MADELIIVDIEGVKYEFDPNHVDNIEAMKLERQCSCTFTQWATDLENGSVTALTALIWILKGRENPKVRFQDVKFDMGGLDIQWTGEDEEDKPEDDEDGTGASDPANPTTSEDPTPDEGTTT